MKTVRFALFFATLAIVPAARAVPAAAGDLILAFKTSSGQGAGVNLEVNLGRMTDIMTAAGGAPSVLTRLAVLDLEQTYGTNWATREDLFWGVAGTVGPAAVPGISVPARTCWASKGEDTAGTSSLPWPRAQALSLQGPSNAIAAMYAAAPGSMPVLPATANSAFSVKALGSDGGAWTTQEEQTPGTSFKYFTPSVMKAINTFSATPSSYDGTAYNVLDLFEVQPGTAGSASVLMGGFGINNTGKFVFSPNVSVFGSGGGTVELGQPSITYTGTGNATVRLENVPAGNYALERSTTLAAVSWTVLTTQAPVSSALTFVDATPPAGRGYYRIRKTP